MHFSIISLFMLATLATANPLQIQIDVPDADTFKKGPLANLLTPNPSERLAESNTADDDTLDIKFGSCYRIKDSNDEKLGLYGVYYQFGGQDGNRAFRVCREAGGSCKHEGRNDQEVRRHEHFYLKDLQGSSISNGATWVANGGSLLYPLPKGYPDLYTAKLWGYRVCNDDDDDGTVKKKDGEDCEVCVSQRTAWNSWSGLSTQANTKYIITSPNADQCVYLKFTKVKCPSHMMSENGEDDGDSDMPHWEI